jgi:hypothetical protein
MSEACDEKWEWTRQAIDVMTAWSEHHGDTFFTASRVMEYAGAEPDGAMKLTVGFMNLTAILLLQLQEATGVDPKAILQDAARVTL